MSTLLHIKNHYYEVKPCRASAIPEGGWYTEFKAHVFQKVGDIPCRGPELARVIASTDTTLGCPILSPDQIESMKRGNVKWILRFANRVKISYGWALTLTIGVTGVVLFAAFCYFYQHLYLIQR
jgi:hypothetical protein